MIMERTINEIAELYGVTRKAIWNRAKKESWPFRLVPGRARGGTKKVFPVETLPPDVQGRIFTALTSDCRADSALPIRKELDEEKARTELNAIMQAPRWSMRKAEARRNIIEAFQVIVDGQKLTSAKIDFTRRYNLQNPNLGIIEETYKVFPRISTVSLDRWRSNFKKAGLSGLLDAKRKGKSPSRVTPKIRDYILGLINNRPLIRPVRVHEYVKLKFSGLDAPVPCVRTIYYFMNQWKAENREVYTFQKNPDEWRNKYQVAYGDASEKAKYFLHMMEFDNTPADLMCADGTRHTITAGIDIFSRKAVCDVIPTSNGQTVSNLIRRIILTLGLFDMAIIDNGKEFISKHTKHACESLSIEILQLPRFSPEKKPFVERFFRSLSTMLFEELEGFIGHNVAERKAIENRKSFAKRMFTKGEIIECSLMPDELQEIINVWIEKIYHQRSHRGLSGKTPEQKAGESTRPVKKISDERVLDVLLAPFGNRTVTKKGIRFENGEYTAPELINHHGYQVEVRRDLADAGRLFIFDQDSKFLCIAHDTSLKGFTVDEAREARQLQKQRLREHTRAMQTLGQGLGDPMAELLESKRQESGQLISFNREEEYESEMTEQAARTFIEVEPVSTFAPVPVLPTEDEKVIPLHKEPRFEFEFERYRYLMEQAEDRPLTEQEKRWMSGYEKTPNYHTIFVMPYEDEEQFL